MRKINRNYDAEQRMNKLREEWGLKKPPLTGYAAHFSYFYAKKGIQVREIYTIDEYIVLVEEPTPKSKVIPQYSGSFVTNDWFEWGGENTYLTFANTIDFDNVPYKTVLKLALSIASEDSFEMTVHGATAVTAYLEVNRGWRKKEKYIYKESLVPKEWIGVFIRL